MYQPRRASRALDAERPVAEAFEGAPRRVARRPLASAVSRFAPGIVSVAVLAGVGGVALNVNAEQDATAVPAPVRATDQASRSEARAALDAPAEPAASAEADVPMDGDGADETPAPEATAEATPEPAPEPTANEAFVGGSWSDAFGTVTGTQFAQKALTVRAQVGEGAAELGQLKAGDKVSVTDKVVDGWTQVAFDAKVGWIQTSLLGAEAPDAPATEGAAKIARSGAKLQWPTAGSIGSKWGMRKHPILGYTRMHGGVDIGGSTGQPIYAAEDGVVTKAAYGYNSGSGNNVRIDHGSLSGKAVETAYLHMHKISVKPGQKVKRGQVIGTLGNTGLSTGPHLHFSLYLNGANSNPAAWLG